MWAVDNGLKNMYLFFWGIFKWWERSVKKSTTTFNLSKTINACDHVSCEPKVPEAIDSCTHGNSSCEP